MSDTMKSHIWQQTRVCRPCDHVMGYQFGIHSYIHNKKTPNQLWCPRSHQPHWYNYGVILKHNYDCLRLENALNNMYHIRKAVSRHKNAHCSLDTYVTYVWRYCETRCLDFVSNEGLGMVLDNGNIPRSHRNFSNNWTEMMGFHCPQKRNSL